MQNPIIEGLFLVDLSGYLIIAAIVALLVAGVATNLAIRARYAAMARDLSGNPTASVPFAFPVLERIVKQARRAARQDGALANPQAIIEQSFQAELKALLMGERFVRATVGLLIILGLIGTFYGLTASIGRLVSLVTADAAGGADMALAVTRGLSQALSGMSVAFTTSLFGIVAAVVMMLLNVFSSVTDRRTALMVELETYLEQLPWPSAATAKSTRDEGLETAVASFAVSVARLETIMTRFDGALQSFATTTRDFREFNLHLKDNVQRMSLGFGDFSESIKAQVAALRARDGG